MQSELANLKNQYEGERIFIIGNGPSLSQTPLTEITNEYAFGMNGIHHIYSETDWKPDFYFFPGPKLDIQLRKQIEQNCQSGVTCFLSDKIEISHQNMSNCYCLSLQPLKHFDDMDLNQVKNLSIDQSLRYWSQDISEIVYSYHSMYPVLQITAYLGFDQVYLVGCDLGYGKNTPHMLFDAGLDPLEYINSTNERYENNVSAYLKDAVSSHTTMRSVINGILFKLLSSNLAQSIIDMILEHTYKYAPRSDNNHFDSHTAGEYAPIDLSHINREIIKGYIISDRIYNSQNKDIVNATIGGNLEVFPRVKFDTIAGE